jgi:hypothetical protein
MILFERVQIFLAGERTFGLRLNHEVLAEVGHLPFAMAFVESDHVGERMHGRLGPQRARYRFRSFLNS